VAWSIWLLLASVATTSFEVAGQPIAAWPEPVPASHASSRAGAACARKSNNASG